MSNEDTFTVPLAVEPDGHAVELPEDAAGWRVRRKTGGRPSIVIGQDGQPAVLPLNATAADLAQFGPGRYRLDPVTEDDEVLEPSIDHEVPGEELPVSETAMVRGRAGVGEIPADAGDIRALVLANVELARACADLVRANGAAISSLSSSQANWIGSLATAKALPKSVAVPVPALEPRNAAPQREEEKEEEEPSPPGWMTGVKQFCETVGADNLKAMAGAAPEALKAVWSSWTKKPAAPANGGGAA